MRLSGVPLGMFRKYWSQIPPEDTCGQKLPIGSELHSLLLSFFLPPFPLVWSDACTKIHGFNSYSSPPADVWLSEVKLSLPTDIQQSLVEEVISKEIAFGLSTSATAVRLSSGQDLPSIIGSHTIHWMFYFFSPTHSPLAPYTMGIRWGPNMIKVHWLWTTLQF